MDCSCISRFWNDADFDEVADLQVVQSLGPWGLKCMPPANQSGRNLFFTGDAPWAYCLVSCTLFWPVYQRR